MARKKHQHPVSARPSPLKIQVSVPAPLPSIPPPPRPAMIAALCALLAVATLAAFWKLHSNGFTLFDDNRYVTENMHVLRGLDRESISWAFTATDAANWHPLTWLSHMLDVQLFGLDAGKQHVTNLLLHMANAILLLLLLFRMTGALWRSAFVAALFALHPLHVESVAWIAERKDVLSTLFWLLTTGAWLAYVKSSKAVPYAMMLAFFALGLMSKPMLVTLPFTLLLLDYWPLQRLTFPLRRRSEEIKKLLWEKAPLFAMAAASSVVTAIIQKKAGAVQTLEAYTFAGRCANAALAYVSYLGKTLWPTSLAAFYPHPRFGLLTWAACGSALLLLAATILAFRLAKRAPYLPFGWFWYLGTLVPVIGLVQVGDQAMADRYTYVPLIGIFIAAAWGLADVVKENAAIRHAAAVAAGGALAALFLLTRIQTGYWSDDMTLFRHALEVTSDNALAHINFGIALGQRGRPSEAMEHFREALRIEPDNTNAMNNLGYALTRLRRLPEALGLLEEAVRRKPNFAEAQNNLGNALVGADRLEEAVGHFRQAVRIQPDFALAWHNLGPALVRLNRMPEAVECLRSVARLHPEYADAQDDLGVALARTGRTAEAIEHYQQALKIRPDFALARCHLGIALIQEHRLTEAQEQFEQALRIKPDYEQARAGLQDVRKALDLAP